MDTKSRKFIPPKLKSWLRPCW